jgi:antirestriction protein
MADLLIYVASLADYNAGRLHGKHIRIHGQDAEEILDEIQRDVLGTSREPVAEEWAIHDYEGFGKYRVSEYESIEKIALFGKVAEEIDDENDVEAFLYWVGASQVDLNDYLDDVDGIVEKFREQFRGTWSSFKGFILDSDYGDMYLGLSEVQHALKEQAKWAGRSDAEQGYEELFDRLVAHIDWDLVAREMEADYDVERTSDNTLVWVFDLNA